MANTKVTNLNIEQGRSELHLVVCDDANRLKDHLVLRDTVAKSRRDTLEYLEPFIETFMASSSSAFRLSHIRRVTGIRETNDVLRSTVSAVGNDSLAGGDLVFASSWNSEDCTVMHRSRVGTAYPNKSIFPYCDSKLVVVDSGSVVLVRIHLRVLRPFRMFWFKGIAMDAIHGHHEVRTLCIAGYPILRPNDL